MPEQPKSAATPAYEHHIWGDTSFEQYLNQVSEDHLLWPDVWHRAVVLLRSTAASLRDSIERKVNADLARIPLERAATQKLIDQTLVKLEPLLEALRTNHSSGVFALFLVLLVALHIFGEWILNISVLPPLLGKSGEGIYGLALAITASLAPFALERVWGANTGSDPWDPHSSAHGGRKALLWAIGILNMGSLGLVAACRSLSVILDDPESQGLSPDQQTLVTWGLTVLSVTIALNAGMFALYLHHEIRQAYRKVPDRHKANILEADLKKLRSQLKELDEEEAKAKSRHGRITRECELNEKEFIAQRMLDLQKRKTRAESAKDPRALTEIVEKIALGQVLFARVQTPATESGPEPDDRAFGASA